MSQRSLVFCVYAFFICTYISACADLLIYGVCYDMFTQSRSMVT